MASRVKKISPTQLAKTIYNKNISNISWAYITQVPPTIVTHCFWIKDPETRKAANFKEALRKQLQPLFKLGLVYPMLKPLPVYKCKHRPLDFNIFDKALFISNAIPDKSPVVCVNNRFFCCEMLETVRHYKPDLEYLRCCHNRKAIYWLDTDDNVVALLLGLR